MSAHADYRESLEFLRRWSPDGRWVLTAIDPFHKERITTRTFGPTTEDELIDWLEHHGKDRNIYFAVNPVMLDMAKKAEREDVKELAWIHVDVDPREGESLPDEQERILDILKNPPEGIPEPTCIIFSGGGYQAFWKLEEPFEIEGQEGLYEEAALYNKQIELLYTADHCHNVDRIMRLPGTLNRPDERKLKKGRQVTRARLMKWNDRVYPLESFTKAPVVQQVGAAFTGHTVKVSGNVQRINDLDAELPDDVPPLCKVVIAQGMNPDEPEKWESRSEPLFWVCCELVRHGCDDDMIYAIITDPDWGISKSVLDKGSRSERYAIHQIERAREFAIDPTLMELNGRHAVISSVGGRCRIISEEHDAVLDRSRITFQTAADFRLRYQNRRVDIPTGDNGKMTTVDLGSWWLNNRSRRQYDTIVFAPERDVPGCYNLWKGFAFDSKPGNCDMYLDHLRDNICSGIDEYYEYTLNWMAHTIQYPAQPGHVSIVLRGRMGTGKGVFASTFGRLFGRHFLAVSNSEHLVGKFNSHLSDCVVLFADEAFYAGDKKHESVLKTLVTEETLAMERKGYDVEQVANCLHLIMASNSQWVVPAGFDERRFFVLDVGNEHMQDKPYFKAIQKQMQGGGYEALLHMLMTRDISDFDPRDMPKTKALQEQKVYSFTPEQEWWYTKLCSGEIVEGRNWPRYVFSTELVEDFTRYIRLWGSASTRSNATKLGNFMRDATPEGHRLRGQLTGTHQVVENGVSRDINRPKVYNLPSLEDARKHWDENFGGPYTWDDPVVVDSTDEQSHF